MTHTLMSMLWTLSVCLSRLLAPTDTDTQRKKQLLLHGLCLAAALVRGTGELGICV